MIRVQTKPKESAQLAFAFPKLKPSQVPPIARRLTGAADEWPASREPRRIKRDRSAGA